MKKSIKNVSHFLFLILNFTVIVAVAGAGEDADHECSKERRCGRGHREPGVRFPFRLRDHHPLRCGNLDSGFELSCDENHHTVLNLPRSAKLFVKSINYTSQNIQIYDPDGCLPKQLLSYPTLNLSESLFQLIPYAYSYISDLVFFNCTWTIDDETDHFDHYVPCLSTTPGYGVRAVNTDSTVSSLAGCRKIVFPASVVTYIRSCLYEPSLYFNWSEPNCIKCEAEGRGCRLKKSINVTRTQTECFDLPKKSTGTKEKILITGAILGTFLLILATIGIRHIHRMIEEKRKHEHKIKQFLEDYKTLKATRYSYVDIWRITLQFRQKLGQGAFGTVYKGKLANNILVAVKILNNNNSSGEEFINEVGAMGRIHHVNVARLVGFCADGIKRALVFEFLPNGSLEKFIFSEDDGKRVVLGLDKLRDIALGIAKGMEYLHHGCEQQILHFDIKPHNILLDHNFVPKISDFGLAKLCSKEKSVVTMTAARGTMGYIAPEVASRNFGKPSYKSDVYSFGMLLLEMVGGRKNIDVNVENASQVYFPEWVYNHLDRGGELGTETGEEEERSKKIGRKMTIVALKCIQWHPADRPSMKDVVHMLEGDGDDLSVPPNPFASAYGTKKVTTRPVTSRDVALEIISEAE